MANHPIRSARLRIARPVIVGAIVAGSVGLGVLGYSFADAGGEPPVVTTVEYPDPINVRERPSLQGHPNENFYYEDPVGQQLRAAELLGWSLVYNTESDKPTFVETVFLNQALPGEWARAFDADNRLMGYFLMPPIFIPTAVFESPDFDLTEAVRNYYITIANADEAVDPVEFADRQVDRIEAEGGLREWVGSGID